MGTATANINQAPLTATADDQIRLQGDANPLLTISYTGFVNSEDVGVLDSLPTASTTATVSSPAGTYPITLTGGADNNYAMSLVNGTLTIRSTSPLLITSVRVANGVAVVTWNAVAGQTYRVQYKNSLSDSTWTDLPPDVTATGPTASKTDNVGAQPQRFYRVLLVQTPTAPPVIQSIVLNDGIATITWSSVAGQTYRVQYKNSLSDSTWTDLPPDVTATGPTASKTDNVGAQPQRLYRVLLVLTP